MYNLTMQYLDNVMKNITSDAINQDVNLLRIKVDAYVSWSELWIFQMQHERKYGI